MVVARHRHRKKIEARPRWRSGKCSPSVNRPKQAQRRPIFRKCAGNPNRVRESAQWLSEGEGFSWSGALHRQGMECWLGPWTSAGGPTEQIGSQRWMAGRRSRLVPEGTARELATKEASGGSPFQALHRRVWRAAHPEADRAIGPIVAQLLGGRVLDPDRPAWPAADCRRTAASWGFNGSQPSTGPNGSTASANPGETDSRTLTDPAKHAQVVHAVHPMGRSTKTIFIARPLPVCGEGENSTKPHARTKDQFAPFFASKPGHLGNGRFQNRLKESLARGKERHRRRPWNASM